jgi:hypothetical protein
MRSPKIPEGAEVVRTFSQYEEHVAAYFQGRYQLFCTFRKHAAYGCVSEN